MIDFHTYPVNVKEFVAPDAELHKNIKEVFRLEAGLQPLETMLLKMSAAGIDKAVLLPMDLTTARGCTIFSNDQIASACKASDRFIGFAGVDPSKKTAVAELKRAVEKLGLKGLYLIPGLQEFYPNDKKVYPLYQAAAGLGIPVMIHAGMEWSVGSRLKYAMPMLVEDVAYDFPNLNIVIARMGWPWVTDTLALLLRYPNVYADTSGHVTGTPKEFVHFEFETQMSISTVENCLRDKLVFGSDYPRVWIKTMADAVRSLKLSGDCFDLIFRRNAEKLLKLA